MVPSKRLFTPFVSLLALCSLAGVAIVGGLVNWLISTIGIGAVVNRYWTKRQEDKGSDSRQRPADSGGVTYF